MLDTLALDLIFTELHKASRKFSAFASPHEGYAVIQEELDELWDAVKQNNTPQALHEAVEVGAMALRFLIDCG